MLLTSLMTYLCILLAMAFYTLLERKVLGLAQIRKGPTKVGFWGIIQPLADAMKLFIKEMIIPLGGNKNLYYLGPSLSLILGMVIWVLYPLKSALFYIIWSLLLFFCITALNVYGTLISGWSSNSQYAFLGGLRAAAQTISYEVSMMLIILFPAYLLMSSSFNILYKNISVLMLFVPITVMWFVSSLAETNRAPFDFAEGESELVSGFNIEFSSGLFALLFMAEYMSILFMSMATSVWFFSGLISQTLMFVLIIMGVSICFLYVRGAFPRFRYDFLMVLCWKTFLPFSLCCLMLMFLSF